MRHLPRTGRGWALLCLGAAAVTALLLAACESRIPEGYQLPVTATPTARVTETPTIPSSDVEPPEVTFVVVWAEIEAPEDGWSALTLDLAVENRTSGWVVVEDAPGSTIRSAAGDVSELTWSGTPGEIPPGFRSRVDQARQPLRVRGRVREGSTGHELDLVYGAYPAGLDTVDDRYRGFHQRISARPQDSGLSYPFLDPGGWEAYRAQFSEQMAILEPGEQLNTLFAVLSVNEVRFLPEGGPTKRYEFALSVANVSAGWQLIADLKGDAWTSTGFAAPLEGRCYISWGSFQDCTVKSTRQALEAGEPSEVCLLLRDAAWSLRGSSEKGTLEQPLLVCFP